jgi:hypothetical protein
MDSTEELRRIRDELTIVTQQRDRLIAEAQLSHTACWKRKYLKRIMELEKEVGRLREENDSLRADSPLR